MADTHRQAGGGLTPEVLLFAALLVVPALWHCVVDGDLAFRVAAERYLLVSTGCAIVSSLVHGYSESGRVVRERLERLDGEPQRQANLPAAQRAHQPSPLDAGFPSLTPTATSPFELDAPDLLAGDLLGDPLASPLAMPDDTLVDLSPGFSPFGD